MRYFKSELLKYKRAFSNKILIIAPTCTAIFAWVVGGFTGYQYMSLYWWYAFLLPGMIAILCSLVNQKEERAGKYYSVFAMPVYLEKFWISKNIVLIEKVLIGAVILSLYICIGNVIAPAIAVYKPLQILTGSVLISIASIWQIPLCLFLAKKTGMFLPVFINTVLGIFLPPFVGNTAIWFLFPHCWSAKLAEPLMGIGLNGILLSRTGFSFNVIPVTLILSVILFVFLSLISAKWFSKQEV